MSVVFQVPKRSIQTRLRPRPQAKASGLRRVCLMRSSRDLKRLGAGLDLTTAKGFPVKSDKGAVSVIAIRTHVRHAIPSPSPLSF